ncbi:hypothetical protein G7046_g371 [Stylonectria norvegica]|nr:hypothetical protein G7046_g371 [Stylonectria norvegica]
MRARMGAVHRISRFLPLVTTTLLIYCIVLLTFNSRPPSPGWFSKETFPNETVGDNVIQTGLKVASKDSDYARISNQTLGFQKVIAIGLKERTDKRDAMSLMSAMTGFKIDWVNGVKAEAISQKAVPYGIDGTRMSDSFLGNWRGHMNTLRHIVDSDISSALILEDNLDWDVHLKGQLDAVARGARHVFGDYTSMPNSPYGDNWDILWLGHCGEPFPETLHENAKIQPAAKLQMSGKYIIHDDLTVPPSSRISHLVDWHQFPAHTRIVHMSAAPMCSFAYAVSQRGARKLLYALSINGLHMAFDNSLAQLCRQSAVALGRGQFTLGNGFGLNCVSVNPTIMFRHKAKGPVSGDRDNQKIGGSIRNKGKTESIKWSMRLNMENVLMGKPLEAQFREGILD